MPTSHPEQSVQGHFRGGGRISSRAAAVTPLSLGSAERRLRRSAPLSSETKPIGRFIAVWEQTSGEAIKPRNFRERRSQKASGRIRKYFSFFAFYSPRP